MIVAVIDYGSGNLKSAAKAIEKVISEIGKGKVVITRDPKEVLNATHIVLPGLKPAAPSPSHPFPRG